MQEFFYILYNHLIIFFLLVQNKDIYLDSEHFGKEEIKKKCFMLCLLTLIMSLASVKKKNKAFKAVVK